LNLSIDDDTVDRARGRRHIKSTLDTSL
jgi:hypothetical protein